MGFRPIDESTTSGVLGTKSASAETNETGTIITYSNDPTDPEGFGAFLRELDSMIGNDPEHIETEGFRDPDPVPANLERNRKRDRTELERNREFLSRNVSIIDARGNPRVPGSVCCGICVGNGFDCVCDGCNPETCEPESDGIENETHSATIGTGMVPVETIAEWVSASLGNEYGFSIWEGLGYWEGIPERTVRIEFQGTNERFRTILATVSRNLPDERFAHVEHSNPRVEYFDMGRERDRQRIREGLGS